MNKKRTGLLALVIFVAAFASGCGYNTLQAKQQNVKAKWAGVETQLQRRADLIPNLFEAAKAAGVQEQEVFGQIAQARSQLLNATQQPPQGENGDKSPEQKEKIIAANNSFGGTLGRLLSLVENYPQLRSSASSTYARRARALRPKWKRTISSPPISRRSSASSHTWIA